MTERRQRPPLRSQVAPLLPLGIAWLASAAVVATAGAQSAVPARSLFLDAQAVADVPWYTGVLSSLGILGWTLSAVIAAGAGWIALRTGRTSAARFLLVGAGATTMLLLDDLLLLHSDVLPRLIGTPKVVNIVLVVGPTLAWVATQRHEIARTRHSVLAAAGAALALSVLADRVVSDGSTGLVIEDGAKLFGIVAWALYFVLTARDIARSTIDAALGADVAGSRSAVDKDLGVGAADTQRAVAGGMRP